MKLFLAGTSEYYPSDGGGTTENNIVLTILRSSNGLALTKRFTSDGPERVKLPRHFFHQEAVLTGFSDLSSLLTDLENRPYQMVAIGRLTEEARSKKLIPRRSRDRDGEIATLVDAGSRVIHFDIDDLDRPEELGWDNPEALTRRTWSKIIEKVPALSQVSVHWQASSSAGTPGKAGKAKFHFWFLVDEPLDSAQRKALMKMAGADPALASPVQPNFTAAPIFDGVEDPLAGVPRSGQIIGISDEARVSSIDWPDFEPQSSNSRSNAALGAASGPLSQGLGSTTPFGKGMLSAAVRGIRGAEIDRNIAINTAAFTVGGWIAGGEINFDEALEALLAAGNDIGHARSEEAVSNGLRGGMLQPLFHDLPPENLKAHFSAPTVDRGTAIAAHGKTIQRWATEGFEIMAPIAMVRRFCALNENPNDRLAYQKAVQMLFSLGWLPASKITESTPAPPRVLLTGAMGVGKTAALVGRNGDPGALHYMAGIVSALYLPTVAKSEEAHQDYLQNAPLGAPPAAIVRGRSAEDPDGEKSITMCRFPERANEISQRGVPVREVLCKRCPFADRCGYLKQESFLADHRDTPEGLVMFLAHEYAFLPLPADVTPEIAIFDEHPRGRVVTPSKIQIEALTEELVFEGVQYAKSSGGESAAVSAARVDLAQAINPLRAKIHDAAQNHPERFLAALRDSGVTRVIIQNVIAALNAFLGNGLSRELKKTLGRFEFMPNVDAKSVESALSSVLGHIPAKSVRPLQAVLQGIEREIDCGHEQATAVIVKEGTITVRSVKKLALGGIPFLHLDGTGKLEMASAIFGPLEHEHHPVERNAIVTQVTSRSFSKSSIVGYDGISPEGLEKASRLQSEILNIVGPVSAVFSNKPVIEALGLADSPNAGWFGAVRGKNNWEEYTSVIVVGREQPPVAAIEDIARAFAVEAGDKFTPLEGRLDEEWRGIRMADGSVTPIKVRIHPDPWAQRVLEQIREAEISQALDRIRLIHNVNPKHVYLLTPVVTDITVDRILSWTEFKNGGSRLDRAAERSNVSLQSGTELARCFPDIWNSSRSAQRDLKKKKSLRRQKGNRLLFPFCRSKESVEVMYKTVKIQAVRSKTHRAIVTPASLSVYDTLELLVGKLSEFSVISEKSSGKGDNMHQILNADGPENLGASVYEKQKEIQISADNGENPVPGSLAFLVSEFGYSGVEAASIGKLG